MDDIKTRKILFFETIVILFETIVLDKCNNNLYYENNIITKICVFDSLKV